MQRVLAIAIRDLRTFFRTPRGVSFFALVIFIWGFYFFNLLGRYNFLVARAAGMQIRSEIAIPSLQSFVIEPYFNLVLVSLVVLISLLAMRSLAEERERGTIELLLTSPGSLSGLVCGKYLALGGLVTIFCIVAGLFPASLLWFGTPDRGAIFSGLFGLTLCGLAFAALSFGVSSFCHRQLSAGVLSVFILSALLLVHTPAPILPSNIREPLQLLSAFLETQQFFDGFISLQGVAYFILLIFTGLWLAASGLRPNSASSSPSPIDRSSKAFIWAGITILITALIIVGIQGGEWSTLAKVQFAAGLCTLLFAIYLIRRRTWLNGGALHAGLRILLLFLVFAAAVKSERFLNLSDTRRYTLSDYSRRILERVSTPLKLRYVIRDNVSEDLRAIRSLRIISSARPQFVEVEILDPVDYPSIVATFGITPMDAVQVVAPTSNRSINLKDLNQDTIIPAIQSIIEPTPARLYLLNEAGSPLATDEGPRGLSELTAKLNKEGVEVVQWSPDENKRLPEDARFLAVIGPRLGVSSHTTEQLREFVFSGGKLLVASDPIFVTPFAPILEEFGIKIRNEVIIDRDQLTYSRGKSGLQPLVSNLAQHPITNNLGSARAVVMNIVAPLAAIPSQYEALSTSELAWVSPGSLSDSEIVKIVSGEKALPSTSPTEVAPPMAVGAASLNSATGARLVAYGDSDWILNSALTYYSNSNLALNSIHWLMGHDWALTQRTTTEFNATVAVSERDLSLMMTATVILVELLFLLAIFRAAR